MSQPPSKNIVLPEDKPIHLFVASEASNLVITEMFTDVVYDNAIHMKQISALTRLGRDLRTAHEQQTAAEKRERGLIDDIPQKSIVQRPPNMVTIIVVSIIGLGVLAYGQYSNQLAGWYAGIANNAGAVIAGLILVLALVLTLRFRRRRPKQ